MKILVTGSDGFVGRHLCPFLRTSGHDVIEPAGPGAPEGLQLTDAACVRSIVDRACPDAVIHLAAVSSVAESHREPARTFAVNALGTVHLLTAVRDVAPHARVLFVSSGEIYGRSASTNPIDEETALEPLSPYAASKAAGETMASQFHRSYGTDVLSVRPFGHIGRGQTAQFVVPSFAAQIAAIQRREAASVLRTGDLSPIRDFLHVDDVVSAYELLLRSGVAGTAYNLGSGRGRSVHSLLIEMLELTSVVARLEVDPARVRPVEIPVLIGDSTRLRALGWQPKREIRAALRDVLEEHGAL